MKVANNDPVVETLKNSHVIQSRTRLTAEWNYNRFTTPTVSNATSVYPELFPVASVIEPRRPQRSGIIKAFANEDILTKPGLTVVPRYRNYVSAKEDEYKYWVSIESNGIAESDFTYKFPKVVAPQVNYPDVLTNKIVIGLENNFVNVSHSFVEIYEQGGAGAWKWTRIATDPTVSLDGQIILYRQSDGTWSSTPEYRYPVKVRNVKFTVGAVDEPKTRVGIIEISARLETDISDYVISWDVNEEISDVSFIAPIGKASSNGGSIVLSNIDGRFSNNNPNSPHYGMIDKNVRFTAHTGIKVGNDFKWVKAFTMWADSWGDQAGLEVSVELVDSSSFMQLVTPPKVLFRNKTVGEIIWTLCDMMGFSNYEYEQDPDDKNTVIPYFWTDGEKSLWEVISNLSEGTQTGVFFDEDDVMQIRTRGSAFQKWRVANGAYVLDANGKKIPRVANWNFDAIRVGSRLPDIEDLSHGNEYEANSVTVKYTPTSVSSFNNGHPVMETSWQPEGTVSLRSARLTYPITDENWYIRISAAEAKVWPYEGLVNVDSELIRYRGKHYGYYRKGDKTYVKTTIYSLEEKNDIDQNKSDEFLAWKNEFTGHLRISERGVNKSVKSDHSDTVAAPNGFEGHVLTDGVKGSKQKWSAGMKINDSIMTLTTNKTFNFDDNYVARSKGSIRLDWTGDRRSTAHWGTRLRFVNGSTPKNHGEAGLFFHTLETTFGGYFVSMYTTDHVELAGGRKSFNEIVIWRRHPTTGKYEQYGKGGIMEVVRGKWYDLDVTMTVLQNGNHVIDVFVDGVRRTSTTATGAGRVLPPGSHSRHGLHVGHHTSVEFEYYYAALEAPDNFDNATFFDQVKGGFSNGYVLRNWYNFYLYDDMGKAKYHRNRGDEGLVFEDFGSYVHEVREYDITFEDPVEHSRLYFSNDSQVVNPSYVGTPFGAKFTLSNASRTTAIVNGEDTATFGPDNSVDQKLFVYGRKITQEDEQEVTVKNDASIRRRGEVKSEFATSYIQTKTAAEELSKWVVAHWGEGADEVEINSFGNPLLQLGDLVTVNYPLKHLYPATHKYIVCGIRTSYSEQGLTSNFILRRVKF